MLDMYYLSHHCFPNPCGNRQEWRIHRETFDERLYILYNGGRNLPEKTTCMWMWDEWFAVDKPTRQQWFKQMRTPITATEITNRMNDICDKPSAKALAPLPQAVPAVPFTQQYYNEEGINPMATNISTNTGVTLAAQPSDASKARDYLVSRFFEMTNYPWNDERYTKLSETFNLHAPTIPETTQEILDAITNKKYTIDQAKVDKQTAFFAARKNGDFDDDDNCLPCGYERGITSRYFGLTFTDLPVEDRKGYDAAVAAYSKAKQDTKDSIMILDPADGLKALQALEAWTPTGAAN